MNEKRELPILNGKLLSDLDANGHKIIGVDIEFSPKKIKEAIAPELEELGEAIAKKVDAEEGKGLSTEDYTTTEKDKLDGIEAGAQKNPDLSGYAKTANVLPRYPFVDAAIVDGVVTIAPYTNAKIASDGTAFTVAVGEGNDYMRDCVLVVECGETTPSVIFDATKFFPRGGDAANLEVVAGKRNIFFITEVQPNQFMVARDELALPEEGGGE